MPNSMSRMCPRVRHYYGAYFEVSVLHRYAHFMALSHPYTAKDVADLFLDNIYTLHGLPTSIVSDRYAVFNSNFWQELFKLQGFQLCLSYHPESDGQTEILNKCLENYIRCTSGYCPKHWAKWQPLAEWWYNTSFHSAIKDHTILCSLWSIPTRLMLVLLWLRWIIGQVRGHPSLECLRRICIKLNIEWSIC